MKVYDYGLLVFFEVVGSVCAYECLEGVRVVFEPFRIAPCPPRFVKLVPG